MNPEVGHKENGVLDGHFGLAKFSNKDLITKF